MILVPNKSKNSFTHKFQKTNKDKKSHNQSRLSLVKTIQTSPHNHFHKPHRFKNKEYKPVDKKRSVFLVKLQKINQNTNSRTSFSSVRYPSRRTD